jgi:hypothetical protein
MVIDNDGPSSGLKELIYFGSSRKVVVSIETDVDWEEKRVEAASE